MAARQVPFTFVKELLCKGFLSEMDTSMPPRKVEAPRVSNCLDALLNLLPALSQRPES